MGRKSPKVVNSVDACLDKREVQPDKQTVFAVSATNFHCTLNLSTRSATSPLLLNWKPLLIREICILSIIGLKADCYFIGRLIFR